MKDGFDVPEDIISLINVPEVNTLLSGGIYAGSRPNGSTSIDIVVNCMGITPRQEQQGTANVNIYVPNLPSGRPDAIRFRTIFRTIRPLLDAQYTRTFRLHLDGGGTFIQDRDGNWLYNVPLKYYSVQINYQNL